MRPTSFVDLPADVFPMKLQLVARADRDRVLFEQTIGGPGMLTVPGQQELGEPVDAVITYSNGRVSRSWE